MQDVAGRCPRELLRAGGRCAAAPRRRSRASAKPRRRAPAALPLEIPRPPGLGLRVEEAARSAQGLVLPPLEREPAGAPRPLLAQERLWFLNELAPSDSSYNIHLSLQIQGALDIGAVGRALSELVRRHESLRAAFAMADGEPRAGRSRARRSGAAADLAHRVPEGRRVGEAERLAAIDTAPPFDLASGPLSGPGSSPSMTALTSSP